MTTFWFEPIQLTYDGVDLMTSDLGIFLKIARGLNESPTVRGVDTIVPASAGRIEQNRINDILDIELRGWVRSGSGETTDDARDDYQSNRVLVRNLFATNRERADLVATLPDGSQLSISARPMPGAIWDEQIPSEFATVSIPMEGYDDWAEVGS